MRSFWAFLRPAFRFFYSDEALKQEMFEMFLFSDFWIPDFNSGAITPLIPLSLYCSLTSWKLILKASPSWLMQWRQSPANQRPALRRGHMFAPARLAQSPIQVDTTKGPTAGAIHQFKTLKNPVEKPRYSLSSGLYFYFFYTSVIFNDWYLQMFLFIPTCNLNFLFVGVN